MHWILCALGVPREPRFGLAWGRDVLRAREAGREGRGAPRAWFRVARHAAPTLGRRRSPAFGSRRQERAAGGMMLQGSPWAAAGSRLFVGVNVPPWRSPRWRLSATAHSRSRLSNSSRRRLPLGLPPCVIAARRRSMRSSMPRHMPAPSWPPIGCCAWAGRKALFTDGDCAFPKEDLVRAVGTGHCSARLCR